MEDVVNGFSEGVADIGGFFTDLGSTIGGFFTDLGSTIGGFFTDLLDGILEGLKGLFIPEEQYFADEAEDFIDKFAFVDSLVEFANRLKDSMLSQEFGSLEVDLSASTSSVVNYGGKVNILDVSWYAPYKQYGDNIISAFLWIAYLWSLFKQLPGIISGASGTVGAVISGSIRAGGKGGD